MAAVVGYKNLLKKAKTQEKQLTNGELFPDGVGRTKQKLLICGWRGSERHFQIKHREWSFMKMAH
jgi:hypothetical protein